MGNAQKESFEDAEAHRLRKEKMFDVRKIYWDQDGNLRHGLTDRNRDAEVLNILKSDDNDDSDSTKLWMIIPSRWVRQWLLFAHVKAGQPPGPIDMWPLLKKDPLSPGGYRPLNTLLPPSSEFGSERPGHYRRISFEAWAALADLYGVNGYALAVRGVPCDELARWRVFKNPKFIDIRQLPEPVLQEEGEKEAPSSVGALAKSMGLGGL
eukprot:CAMPEP_0173360780 /NCGR_PEP_ID=MMETSP1144-20121109/20805_1 /TAXON_ID=483371 /ORGANISM="non described non described, Strain CCMP2298" /LENGTH=208 /DNA_ID=CAMNT_0014310227 /DNA_START=86 /DNA_END=708 /DNA_ORIENTATION=-